MTSLLEAARQLEREAHPRGLRVDAQWMMDALIVVRDERCSYCVTRREIDSGAFLAAAPELMERLLACP